MYTSIIIQQVTLPTKITERYGHSAVAFGSGYDFKVIVLFGGCSIGGHMISETTILMMSKSYPKRI